jgi:tetratricopeptide (TPR) repeat protein
MIILALTCACTPAFSQVRHQKPALIRDTDKAEGKEEAEASKEKEFSPILAEQSVKIGDYYLKKKNFDAAIERYIEALQYQPGRVDAYEGLGKTYEKMGETLKAQEIYRDFIKKNPDSPKLADFRAKLAKLEKK